MATTATTPTKAPLPSATSSAPDDVVGQKTGTESSLSTWVGPYVTNMLGRAEALADQPYEAYTGQLTAGASTPQQKAFKGISGLTIPSRIYFGRSHEEDEPLY